MHHPQYFDDVTTQAVSHDVRRSTNHQFARPRSPARPADFRKLQQSGDCRENPLDLPVRCRWVVAGNISARRRKVA
jgi:hypothetical protein